MRILVLIATDPDGAIAGVELSSLAGAYYALRDRGAEVALASASGGSPALDRGSVVDLRAEEYLRRLQADLPAREEFADTLRFDQICLEDFDAVMVLFPDAQGGGNGRESGVQEGVGPLLTRALGSKRPVAVFGNMKDLERQKVDGLLIVAGRHFTAAEVSSALLEVLAHRRHA